MFKTPQALEPATHESYAAGAPPTLPGGGDGEIHLLDRLSVLYRYRRLAISLVLLVFIGGIVQTFSTIPRFRATSVVEIAEERPLASSLRDVEQQISWQDPEVHMETQLSVLRSRDLARIVVKHLDLKTHPEFMTGAEEPTGLRAAFASITARVTRPLRQLLQKEQPSTTADATGSAGASESPEEAALVSAFLGHVQIQRRPISRLVNVSFDSRDRELAARAANALAVAYVDANLSLKRRSLEGMIAQYEKEIQNQKDSIDTLERALFTARQEGTGPVNANVLGVAMATFSDRATRGRQEAMDKRARYEELSAVAGSEIDIDDPKVMSVPAVVSDPVIASHQAELTGLTRKRQLARTAGGTTRGESHPEIVAINNDINAVKNSIVRRITLLAQTARQEYQNAMNDASRYQNLLTQKEQEIAKAGISAVQPGFIENDITTSKALLSNLTTEMQQTKVAYNSTENNVRTMDRAEVPVASYTPNVANNLLMALLAGVVLALAVAFGLEYLDDTIKTPEDITRKLRVPFLGLVPSVAGDKQPLLSGPVPHDFGEAYRALRTSLVFTSGGEKTRVIVVTSAQPLEGKTTTACNLGMVLAFGGSRVLLIDADMRRPGVHKALKINNTVGLSHLLVGQARVREAIQRTADPNFCVMTAGRTPPNPSELLSSERMRQLVANLSEGPFDWVIIDTPPVLAVTDAVVVTPMASGTIFVLGAEMTRRRLAERAVQMVLQTRPKLVGCVLNRVNFDRNKYYYSRYYGYQYKSYYGPAAKPENTASNA
ncbi:MAG: polysaccharide biosynthesis tyrosine autokinase [Acidobacteria bacterium]|nr:polysaccharide biosynthesis tyrosine autokinase [Acidobacteriota bacterium]